MSDPWSEIASRYAEVTNDVRQRFLHPTVLEIAKSDVPRHARCLDYGCGPGELTLALAGLFDEIVAVDRAPEALEAARRRLGNDAVVVDPSTFASTQGTFDAIVLSMVLTTVKSDSEVEHLLEVLSVRLALDGRLVIGTTHPCFTFRALAQVSYASSGAPYRVPIEPGMDVTEYHRPLERVVDLVAGTGMRITRAREIYDDPEYYRAKGETPHRFAGVLPMFLVLTCGHPAGGGSR